MQKKLRTLPLLLGSLVVIVACSTTSMVQSWKNPRAIRPTSVMVFGVTQKESVRRTYEDSVSSILSTEGLPTTPSYDVIEAPGEVTPKEAMEAVRKAGVDAVLITRLVRLSKEVEVAPDISAAPPFGYGPIGGPYYSPLWPSYYYSSYRLIEHEAAYIESNLYKADSSALLISVLTRTEDPNYSTRQTHEIARVISDEFRRAGFIPASP